MSFLIIFFLLITYLSAINCDPTPLTEKALKRIIGKNSSFEIDSHNLEFSKTGPLGLSEHSIVWEGKLNGKVPVAIKISWNTEYSVREKKILNLLKAQSSNIEKKGIPRIYCIGPFLQEYDAIVMTLFECDLERRWEKEVKEKEHINDLSLLWIFKRSLEILKYLNEHKIVHNDIKPGNIFLNGQDVFISDFDISTVGEEQTIHATRMFASLNYFMDKDHPNRTTKDDLESLVYTMWYIANIKQDPYVGKSGSMDVRQPEGLSLLFSLGKEGAATKFASKCSQLPPALVDVFTDICLKELVPEVKVPNYGRIINLVSKAVVEANNGSLKPPQFEWIGKPDNPSFCSKFKSILKSKKKDK